MVLTLPPAQLQCRAQPLAQACPNASIPLESPLLTGQARVIHKAAVGRGQDKSNMEYDLAVLKGLETQLEEKLRSFKASLTGSSASTSLHGSSVVHGAS